MSSREMKNIRLNPSTKMPTISAGKPQAVSPHKHPRLKKKAVSADNARHRHHGG